MMQMIEQLCRQVTGCEPLTVTSLTPAGSPRRYFRLATAQGSMVATVGTSVRENEAFFALTDHFIGRGLPVPRVLAVSPDHLCYLQQDLGDTQLISRLDCPGLLEQAMATLPRFQQSGFDRWDVCHPVAAMDCRSVMWDLNYFKYCFLKPSGIEPDEPALEADFDSLAREVLTAKPQGLMLRDFQSRNVMVGSDDSLWLIDYQGARRGPMLYDVASFLWQAKAGFSSDQRSCLSEVYRREAGISEEGFEASLRLMALFRTLQVLGAYGFRGLVEQKAHFIESIRPAVANLQELLPVAARWPELARVLTLVCAKESYRGIDCQPDGLTVEVNSFGYRKGGLPRDLSGNGGGFVFDCRAITNPGRLAEFRTLTGERAEVAAYLEADGKVTEFLNHAYALVDSVVEVYMRRGFSRLMVSFGCTGGQHRSVYCASHMAQHLRETFGVNVELVHRERGSWP